MSVPRFDQPIHTDINVLHAIDLRNAEDRAALKRRWRAMLSKLMVEELQEDFKAIKQLSNETFENSEVTVDSSAVEELMATTQWSALFHLNMDQVVELCKNHFDIALDLELDWQEMADDMSHVLLQAFDLETRQQYKDKMRDAIKASSARIGGTQIILGAESTDPTIANWYRDFRDFTKGEEGDALDIVEYLNNSKNAQSLTSEERAQLEAVLKLIKELSIPSTAFGGYEQKRVIGDAATGHYMYYSQGKLTDTGIEIEPEQLAEIRKAAGLDENGQPVSLAEQVKGAITEGRYALPPEVSEIVESIEPAESTPMQSVQQTVAEEAPVTVEEPAVEQMTAELPPLVSPSTAEPVTVPMPELDERPTEVTPLPTPVPPLPEETEAIPLLETLPTPTPEPIPEPVAAPTPELAPLPESIPVPEPVPMPVEQPMAQQPSALKPKQEEQIDFMDIAQRVLAEYNILFAEYEQEKRFVSIVASYLRGVRDRMEAHDALSRSPEEGGVDLRVEQIDEMLDTAEYLLDQEHENPQQKRGEVRQEQSEGPRPTLGEIEQKIQQQRERDAEEWKDVPVLQREAETGGVEDIFSNISLDMDTQSAPAVSEQQQMREQANMPTAAIADEKLPVMMGPIDELRNMTRTEYRQFNTDAQKAAQEILEKIELLGQESIQKKAEGIDAWKQSPLNKLYVAIGNRSFNDAIPVSQAIAVMEGEGKDTLTEEEFHAIADMNSQLRF